MKFVCDIFIVILNISMVKNI